MSPLRIKTLNPNTNQFVPVGEVKPGDPSGSMSSNNPDGSRDIYLFECEPDDSKSVISRSKAGVDAEIGNQRAITTEGLEVVKELHLGESLELSLKTDVSPIPRTIRFTQK